MVWRTDVTALRACDSSTLVRSPYLVSPSLLVEVLQPLFSKRFVARVSHPRVGISRLSKIVLVNLVLNRTAVHSGFCSENAPMTLRVFMSNIITAKLTDDRPIISRLN